MYQYSNKNVVREVAGRKTEFYTMADTVLSGAVDPNTVSDEPYNKT